MTLAVFESDDLRREWARRAEVHEGLRLNVKQPEARKSLARRWGVSFWTLTNWHRGRLKDLRSGIRDRIDQGILRELDLEIKRLSHELELARQCGARLSDDETTKVQASIEKLHSLLVEAKGDEG